MAQALRHRLIRSIGELRKECPGGFYVAKKFPQLKIAERFAGVISDVVYLECPGVRRLADCLLSVAMGPLLGACDCGTLPLLSSQRGSSACLLQALLERPTEARKRILERSTEARKRVLEGPTETGKRILEALIEVLPLTKGDREKHRGHTVVSD